MSIDLSAIFDHSADLDPAADFEAFLQSVPAKWVVYLFADETNQPVRQTRSVG